MLFCFSHLPTSAVAYAGQLNHSPVVQLGPIVSSSPCTEKKTSRHTRGGRFESFGGGGDQGERKM